MLEGGSLQGSEFLPLIFVENLEYLALQFCGLASETAAEQLIDLFLLRARDLQRLGDPVALQRPYSSDLNPNLVQPLPLLLGENVFDVLADLGHHGPPLVGPLATASLADHLRGLPRVFRLAEYEQPFLLLGIEFQLGLHRGIADQGEHVALVLPSPQPPLGPLRSATGTLSHRTTGALSHAATGALSHALPHPLSRAGSSSLFWTLCLDVIGSQQHQRTHCQSQV